MYLRLVARKWVGGRESRRFRIFTGVPTRDLDERHA